MGSVRQAGDRNIMGMARAALTGIVQAYFNQLPFRLAA
jgi:hypothetical protein